MNKQFIGLVTILILVSILMLCGCATTTTKTTETKYPSYEYKVWRTSEKSEGEIQARLKRLGAEGWLLTETYMISEKDRLFILSRPKR